MAAVKTLEGDSRCGADMTPTDPGDSCRLDGDIELGVGGGHQLGSVLDRLERTLRNGYLGAGSLDP